jgi:hypothetical protein
MLLAIPRCPHRRIAGTIRSDTQHQKALPTPDVAITGTQTFFFGIMTLSVRKHRCLLRQQIECRVPLYNLPLNTCFCTILFEVVGFGRLRLLARLALIEHPGILAGDRTGSWARDWKHSEAMDYSRGLPHLRCYWRRCDPPLSPLFLMKVTSHGFLLVV